jgi:hypothetical protein
MYHDDRFVNGSSKDFNITYMPKISVHKLAVKSVAETAFSLHRVTANPRQCSPTDLQRSADNLKLEPLTADVPEAPLALVHYLLTDFFAQFHRTGLYNRQLALWESLARICEVHIERLKEGVMAKIELPIWEIRMLDAKGQKLLLARFLDHSATNLIDPDNGKDAARFLQYAIKRAEKLKVESPAFAGLILCCSGQMPEIIIGNVAKLTGDDAVARYQSLLPTIGCPVDLIVERSLKFSLVQPQLPERIKSISLTMAKLEREEQAPSEESVV